MIYLQQQLPTIALTSQLLLIALSFDSDGDLPCQQSREFSVNFVVNTRLITPEIENAKSLIGCGKRKATDCLDGMIHYRLSERETIFFQRDIVEHYRLLMLPNPAGD